MMKNINVRAIDILKAYGHADDARPRNCNTFEATR